MTTFTSTDPAVIAAVRSGIAAIRAGLSAAHAWREHIGADALFTFGDDFGVQFDGVSFPGNVRPDSSWTTPNRRTGMSRPKKNTPTGQELAAQMRGMDVRNTIPGARPLVHARDERDVEYLVRPSIWEHDGVVWMDTGDKTIRPRDLPDPALWTPASRSAYLAATEEAERKTVLAACPSA